MCSISSESNSTDLYGTHRGRSMSQPPPLQVSRLCSVSSQDSGFNSHDGGVRKTAQRLESLFQRQNSDEGAAVTNPIYDSRPADTPPHLPRRNNSLPSNSLFDQSAASSPSGSQPSTCRSEPQSPQMARAGFSVTQSTPDNGTFGKHVRRRLQISEGRGVNSLTCSASLYSLLYVQSNLLLFSRERKTRVLVTHSLSHEYTASSRTRQVEENSASAPSATHSTNFNTQRLTPAQTARRL